MTLRASAVADLTAYAPETEDGRRHRAEFLALLAERPDALSRSCVPDHLTASAVVVDPAGARVCLVLHAKVRRWLQPGGHCEAGDASLAAAALREAAEETGVPGLSVVPGVLDVDRHAAPCNPGVVRDHLDVRYLVLAPPEAPVAVSEESLDVRWFGWDALPGDLEASVVRAVAGARAFCRMGTLRQ